jgi:hypothetical protein
VHFADNDHFESVFTATNQTALEQLVQAVGRLTQATP